MTFSSTDGVILHIQDIGGRAMRGMQTSLSIFSFKARKVYLAETKFESPFVCMFFEVSLLFLPRVPSRPPPFFVVICGTNETCGLWNQTAHAHNSVAPLIPCTPLASHLIALCFMLTYDNRACCPGLLGGLREIMQGMARTVAAYKQYSVNISSY